MWLDDNARSSVLWEVFFSPMPCTADLSRHVIDQHVLFASKISGRTVVLLPYHNMCQSAMRLCFLYNVVVNDTWREPHFDGATRSTIVHELQQMGVAIKEFSCLYDYRI